MPHFNYDKLNLNVIEVPQLSVEHGATDINLPGYYLYDISEDMCQALINAELGSTYKNAVVIRYLEDYCVDEIDAGYVTLVDNSDETALVYKYNGFNEVNNPDALIVLFYWAIFYAEKGQELQLEIQTDNVYWIFHDIIHAKNDTHGGEVYVEEASEITAMLDGAKLMYEVLGQKPKFSDEQLADMKAAWKVRFRGSNMPWKEFYQLIEIYDPYEMEEY